MWPMDDPGSHEDSFPFGTAGRFVAGGGLAVLGVAGLALPILPGWALIVPGLAILSPVVPALQPLHDRAIEIYHRFVDQPLAGEGDA